MIAAGAKFSPTLREFVWSGALRAIISRSNHLAFLARLTELWASAESRAYAVGREFPRICKAQKNLGVGACERAKHLRSGFGASCERE